MSSIVLRSIFGAALLAISLTLGTRAAFAQVVVVVSAKSSIQSLSRQEVEDFFLGKGNSRYGNGQIVPIDQPEGTPIRDEFYSKVTGKSPAQLKAYWSRMIFTGRGLPPRVVESREVRKILIGDEAAIGYVDRSFVDDDLKIVLFP